MATDTSTIIYSVTAFMGGGDPSQNPTLSDVQKEQVKEIQKGWKEGDGYLKIQSYSAQYVLLWHQRLTGWSARLASREIQNLDESSGPITRSRKSTSIRCSPTSACTGLLVVVRPLPITFTKITMLYASGALHRHIPTGFAVFTQRRVRVH